MIPLRRAERRFDGKVMTPPRCVRARQNGALDIYTARADGTNLVHVTTALVPISSGEGDELPDWGPHPLAT